jgi:phosphoribosylformylglycinamidine (FGAM) synthase-like enzyme
VVAVDLPIDLLTDDAPKYERPMREPAAQAALPVAPVTFATPTAAKDSLLAFLGSPNLGSRAWIYRQYDSIVGDGTVVGPGQGDAAVVRVFCGAAGEKFLVLSVDCNGRQVELDAFAGAAMAVAECARNIVCTGGRPLGLTDCLNFGSPEKPETMWRIAKAIDGVAAACTALGVPVVSGNVSLYNETDGSPILPTPTVAIVGEMTDPTTRLGMAFRAAGDTIAVLGAPSRGHLDGSEWQVQRDGKPRGASAGIDLALEVRLQEAILEMASARVLESAHDVSDGGLFACLAESCMAGRLGADVSSTGFGDDFAPLLGEEPSRVVVSVGAQHLERAQSIAAKHGVPWKALGRAGGTALRLTPTIAIEVSALAAAHSQALTPIVGAD